MFNNVLGFAHYRVVGGNFENFDGLVKLYSLNTNLSYV